MLKRECPNCGDMVEGQVGHKAYHDGVKNRMVFFECDCGHNFEQEESEELLKSFDDFSEGTTVTIINS